RGVFRRRDDRTRRDIAVWIDQEVELYRVGRQDLARLVFAARDEAIIELLPARAFDGRRRHRGLELHFPDLDRGLRSLILRRARVGGARLFLARRRSHERSAILARGLWPPLRRGCEELGERSRIRRDGRRGALGARRAGWRVTGPRRERRRRLLRRARVGVRLGSFSRARGDRDRGRNEDPRELAHASTLDRIARARNEAIESFPESQSVLYARRRCASSCPSYARRAARFAGE